MSEMDSLRVRVGILLGDRVNAGLHHGQAFTAFYVVWKLLDAWDTETETQLFPNPRGNRRGAGSIPTVFTNVQLFEVNQAGDGGGQVGQVVVGHAQLLQGLAAEELLWKHRVKTIEYQTFSTL